MLIWVAILCVSCAVCLVCECRSVMRVVFLYVDSIAELVFCRLYGV
jgi:hypothetical protein